MKTSMQEMLEYVHDEVQLFGSARQILISKIKEMIEKEKEQRMEAWCKGYDSYDEDISGDSPLEYYNKAFNTKEK